MTFHYIDLMKSFALHNVLKKVKNRAYNSDKKRVSMKHKIHFKRVESGFWCIFSKLFSRYIQKQFQIFLGTMYIRCPFPPLNWYFSWNLRRTVMILKEGSHANTVVLISMYQCVPTSFFSKDFSHLSKAKE